MWKQPCWYRGSACCWYIQCFLLYMCMIMLYARMRHWNPGIKGVYRDGAGASQKEQNIEADLEQKLSQRLLWMKEKQVEVQVSPVRVRIRISGGGSYFPKERIE